jgi:hypothetical protein
MEHVELEEDALNTIMTVSEGDMRKAVTYLQSAHELAGKNSSISSDIVLDVSGQVSSLPSLLPSLSSDHLCSSSRSIPSFSLPSGVSFHRRPLPLIRCDPVLMTSSWRGTL